MAIVSWKYFSTTWASLGDNFLGGQSYGARARQSGSSSGALVQDREDRGRHFVGMVHRLFRPGGWLGLIFFLACLSLACGAKPPPKGQPSAMPVADTDRARVLFVLSSAGEQVLANGRRRRTGYFLSEFYEPYAALRRQGHELYIATPEGKAPVVDPEGLKDDYWEDESARDLALTFAENDPGVARPLSLDEALLRASEWDGLVVPGGQGVMVDLYQDEKMQKLLTTLGERRKAVGLICHAPALLSRLKGEHPFLGREVTAVSPFEEFYIETFVMGGRAQTRRIGRSLRRAGFDYGAALPKVNHAVRDCNLVTSQNPFSGDAFLEEFLNALRAAKQGRPCARQ